MNTVNPRKVLKWVLWEILVEGLQAEVILELASEMSCKEAGVAPGIR